MERREVRVGSVSPSTLATFEGLFAAVVGFAVAVVAWISTAGGFNADVTTVLRGMLFGFSPGLLSVILDTIIYFVAGWIVGYVHGTLFNLVANAMNGVEVATKDLGEQVRTAAPSRAGARRAEPTFGETLGRRRDDL